MPKKSEQRIDTGISVVILLGTIASVFVFGALFSVQYEYNCTYNPATKEPSCTERRAWDGSGAVQALSAIAGAGVGGAAAIWKAGGLPNLVRKFLGGSVDEEAS